LTVSLSLSTSWCALACLTVLYALPQLAANFLNDSWETTLCLRHPANFLAAGMLYSAIKVTKTEVPLQEGGKPWCAPAHIALHVCSYCEWHTSISNPGHSALLPLAVPERTQPSCHIWRRYELAAGATQQQLEAFDAEVMQLYQQMPVDGKSGKRAASKAGAGPKPAADASKAVQQNGEGRQHVPPAPGTPVSAGDRQEVGNPASLPTRRASFTLGWHPVIGPRQPSRRSQGVRAVPPHLHQFTLCLCATDLRRQHAAM
jgi:hypothetical protein